VVYAPIIPGWPTLACRAGGNDNPCGTDCGRYGPELMPWVTMRSKTRPTVQRRCNSRNPNATIDRKSRNKRDLCVLQFCVAKRSPPLRRLRRANRAVAVTSSLRTREMSAGEPTRLSSRAKWAHDDRRNAVRRLSLALSGQATRPREEDRFFHDVDTRQLSGFLIFCSVREGLVNSEERDREQAEAERLLPTAGDALAAAAVPFSVWHWM
jgi:predicted Fe-S protein YdhL (DUF1289 family)